MKLWISYQFLNICTNLSQTISQKLIMSNIFIQDFPWKAILLSYRQKKPFGYSPDLVKVKQVHSLEKKTYLSVVLVIETLRPPRWWPQRHSPDCHCLTKQHWCHESNNNTCRDEDPILAKNRIRGFVAQTKGDF